LEVQPAIQIEPVKVITTPGETELVAFKDHSKS